MQQDLPTRTITREDFAQISTRSPHKDLYKIMQEPLRKDFVRISARPSHKDLYKIAFYELRVLCKPAWSKCIWTSQKNQIYARINPKNAVPETRSAHFVRACSIKMHIDTSEEQFYAEICRRNAAPDTHRAFCAGLRSRNAHGHVT